MRVDGKAPVLEAQSDPFQIEGDEVRYQQQETAIGRHMVPVLEPHHLAQPLRRTEPGDRGFEQRASETSEMGSHDLLPGLRRPARKAQAQIGSGNEPPLARQREQQHAETISEGSEQRQRHPMQDPHQGQDEPDGEGTQRDSLCTGGMTPAGTL